jgi:hypothetical protein
VTDVQQGESRSHPEVRAAVDATGPKEADHGVYRDRGVPGRVGALRLKDGFEVYFVSGCSAGVTKEAHDDAKLPMKMAGARPVNWIAILNEWAPDYTNTPEPTRDSTLMTLARHNCAWVIKYAATGRHAGGAHA